VKILWIHREIDAPVEVSWRLLAEPDRWPEWGPSVRSVVLDGDRFDRGATGTVTSVVGIELRFEVTDYREGEFWAWNVAGLPATHHSVESLGSDRCRVAFGVPWVAAPYLAVCEIALRRIDKIVEHEILTSERASR
jgi:hypothetical protein